MRFTKFRPNSARALVTASTLAIAAAWTSAALADDHEPEPESAHEEVILYDFEAATVSADIGGANTEFSLVEHDGGTALRAEFATSVNRYANITMSPANPVDLSGHDIAGFALDMYNPGTESVQVNVDLTDAGGQIATRSTIVPAGGGGTYYIEVAGPDISADTGLRDTPSNWLINATKLTWMWGARDLDENAITGISLNVGSLSSDRSLVVDNVRAVFDPPHDPDYLVGLIDPYGQPVDGDYAERVTSDLDLQERALAEIDALNANGIDGRSRWQGWADGPQLEATGYFRTEKVGDRWSLVDPDGFLYFATGIDNIRMANTSTMTGYEFRPGAIRARDPNDTTPEDSTGLNRAPDSALSARYRAWDTRAYMFTWLPSYDSALGDHYGYRREVHSGPLASGETYSFYRANLERKYGDRGDDSFIDDWRQITNARMLDWGFTSFGNWLDPTFYEEPSVPYFANGWIIGDFKTVSSGDDYWSPLPDPFDPEFAERARATAAQVAGEVQGSPWCVGVFIDNEKSWGRTETITQHYGIVIHTMGRSADESPTKAVWSRMLREKYDTIDALNAAWDTDIASWDELEDGVELTDHTDGKIADYAILLEEYAAEYFRIVDGALNEVLPDHMYLGSRFATWGMTPEVVRAAARYVDVVSYNEYQEVPHAMTWDFLSEIDMPSIIGEFHMGSPGGANYHPGLIFSEDQEDRGRKYTNYMDTVIGSDYFVGAHWFQYTDSPVTGRAYDGENYNVGFVTVADIPYAPLVDAAREVNRTLYQDRFGDLVEAAEAEE